MHKQNHAVHARTFKGSATLIAYLAVICCLIVSCPQAGESPRPYWSVTETLAKVRQTDDLMDTVHKNPYVLEAVGLFLQAADADGVPEHDLEKSLLRLFPPFSWHKWVPHFEIKRVRSGLYLVSIGYAVTTQASSLYLFDGPGHSLIDSGELGTIHIHQVGASDSSIVVRYERTPGSSRPEFLKAWITKRGAVLTVETMFSGQEDRVEPTQ